MDVQGLEKRPRHVSVPGLIAWLSVCLLAAAWGRTVDERWQNIWVLAGTFGLAAALGLGSLEKARLFRKNWVREQALQLRFEGRLTELNERNAALELIDDAIGQVAKYAASQRKKLRGFPLAAIPVDKCTDTFELASARSITGSLRKISSSVVNFEHDEAFAERVVLLTFKLEEQRQLCFVVDILGTQKTANGFASSGIMMAVGVPAHQGSESALAESGDACESSSQAPMIWASARTNDRQDRSLERLR
jgi:hypothetical protein